MKTIIVEPSFAQFLQMHDTALALGLIFAFAGAFAFAPKVIK